MGRVASPEARSGGVRGRQSTAGGFTPPQPASRTAPPSRGSRDGSLQRSARLRAFLKVKPDRFERRLAIAAEIDIPDAYGVIAACSAPGIALAIGALLGTLGMTPAVDLDHEARAMTNEIGDIRAHRNLPADVKSGIAPAAQDRPGDDLVRRHSPPHCACPLCPPSRGSRHARHSTLPSPQGGGGDPTPAAPSARAGSRRGGSRCRSGRRRIPRSGGARRAR